MKRDAKPVSEERRAFVRRAGITTGAAAAVATAPGVAIGSPEAVEDAQETETRGYRLTRHVLDYYKSAAD